MTTTTTTTTTFGAGAIEELKHLLTIPQPTQYGNANPQAVAHAALEQLRESGDENFIFLRTILDLVSSSFSHHQLEEELLFHCITGCRHVILTRWESFSTIFKKTVRDCFMIWGDNIHNYSNTIRMCFYTSSVSLWKRGWTNELTTTTTSPSSSSSTSPRMMSSKEQHLFELMKNHLTHAGMTSVLENPVQLINHLQDRINNTNNTHTNSNNEIIEGTCQYISALVGEFSGKSACTYNQSMEFHKTSHAIFEKETLEECLKITMQALSNMVSKSNTDFKETEACAVGVVHSTIEILSWEFGASAWLHLSSRTTLIRPPANWRPYILRPDFVRAIVIFHQHVHSQNLQFLAQQIRQLLLLLCGISGPIFQDKVQLKLYAQFFCDGTQQLLSLSLHTLQQQHTLNDDDLYATSALLLDSYSLASRLLTNFRLDLVSDIPSFASLLDALRDSGIALLQANLKELEQVHGDINTMENGEWREEALAILLEVIVSLCQDPWLRDQRREVEQKSAVRGQLHYRLAPLYESFIMCRRKMVYMEEVYNRTEGELLSEEEEAIQESNMKEEMEALAALGRMCITNSISVLGVSFQDVATKVLAQWNTAFSVTPDSSGVVKDTELVVGHLGHLLADDTGKIPSFIETECEDDTRAIDLIAEAIRCQLTLMQEYGSRISSQSSNVHLSPKLGQTFVWFLQRWVGTYVYSSTGGVDRNSKIKLFWSVPEAANQVLDFCSWICLQYLQWQGETQVQESATTLLQALGKGNKKAARGAIKQSTHFQQLHFFHCISLAVPDKNEALAQIQNASLSVYAFQNFDSLPLVVRAKLLTSLIIILGDCDSSSESLFNDCMRAVQHQLHVLTHSNLSEVTESTVAIAACIAMFQGLVEAVPLVQEPERVGTFIIVSLPLIARLLNHHVNDLVICEQMLGLLCTYSENIKEIKLEEEQVSILLRVASEVLQLYATHHCTSRVIHAALKSTEDINEQEEKAYEDILCALQLIKNLLSLSKGDPAQLAEVSFFGIQQLIPLMTQGLLTYPTLCMEYFSVISCIVDRHPEKIGVLPNDLLNGLLQSLQLGIVHHDTHIAKRSLSSLEGLYKAHLQYGILQNKLDTSPDLFRSGIVTTIEILYQQILFDRLEETSAVVLALIALDKNGFLAISEQIANKSRSNDPQTANRFHCATQKLIQPQLIEKVLLTGYEVR